MNIHIFGHSICLQSETNILSFTDILVNRYDIKPHQLHISLCGTEERILYFLKKVKEPIDIVIIFHGDPSLMFVPSLPDDMHPSTNTTGYFWDNPRNIQLRYHEHVVNDKTTPNVQLQSRDDFKIAFEYLLKYFFTRDLNTNRHYGALVQIDQYLKYKNIHAIHCVLENTLPSWFTFSSGIVDTEITTMQQVSSKYRCDGRLSNNKINEEGNKLIAEKLIGYINMARLAGIEPTF